MGPVKVKHQNYKMKFYEDRSRYCLKQKFEKEKNPTDDVSTGTRNIARFSAKCLLPTIPSASSQMSHLQEQKNVGRDFQQHQKLVSALEKCCYCLDQPNMKRHLIVKTFEKVYLSIPDFPSLLTGHCLIVPRRHVRSFLDLNEEEWMEVEELKKKLRKLFQGEKKKLIIMETSLNLKSCPHACLEIVPVTDAVSQVSPIYFKKAILESESEWANNKKLIDLTKKNIRQSVPKNLPYFWVEFDPDIHSGFAHVIEDERNFGRNFGKEVLGGIIGIEYKFIKRKDALTEVKETMSLTNMWKKNYV